MTDEPKLDPRRHAYREDLAAKSLEGRVEALRFVDGQTYQVCAPHTGVRRQPGPDAPLDTEALMGEQFTIYEKTEGWAWGQLERDGYVGYVSQVDLSSDILIPTHRISGILVLVYAAPSALSAPVYHLSFNALVTVIGEHDAFAELATGGFVGKKYLAKTDSFDRDYIAAAQRFLNLPYLFGGKSALGLDCSGLVQNVMQAAGYNVPRDSDMQAAEIGQRLEISKDLKDLQRGDVVFWPQHVGLMVDGATIIHASATNMSVALEPVETVAERSRKDGPIVASVSRPAG